MAFTRELASGAPGGAAPGRGRRKGGILAPQAPPEKPRRQNQEQDALKRQNGSEGGVGPAELPVRGGPDDHLAARHGITGPKSAVEARQEGARAKP